MVCGHTHTHTEIHSTNMLLFMSLGITFSIKGLWISQLSAGETAQLVKRFLCKHENSGMIPKIQVKKSECGDICL